MVVSFARLRGVRASRAKRPTQRIKFERESVPSRSAAQPFESNANGCVAVRLIFSQSSGEAGFLAKISDKNKPHSEAFRGSKRGISAAEAFPTITAMTVTFADKASENG